MKFRVTASSIIISLLLCVFVLALVFTLGFAKLGYDKVTDFLSKAMTLGDSGITVSVQSMDGTLARAITLNDIKLTYSNKTYAHIDKATLSIGLFSIVKLGLGWSTPDVNLTVSNAKVYVSNEALALLANLTNKGKEGSEPSSSLKLPNLKLNLQLQNASAIVDYKDIKSNITNLYASASLLSKNNKISFEGADLNLPTVTVILPSQLVAEANDIRLSVDENFQITASFVDASLDGYGKASEISALMNWTDGKLKLATYMEKVDASYSDYKAQLGQLTLNVDYELETEQVDLKAYMGQLSAQVPTSVGQLEVRASEFSLSGVLTDLEQADLNLYMEKIVTACGEFGATINGVTLNLDVVLSSLKTLGYVDFNSLTAVGLRDYTIQSLSIKNGEVDFSYNNMNIDARLKAYVNGYSTNFYLEKFSSNVDISASLGFANNCVEISSVTANLENLVCAATPEETPATINLNYSAQKEASVAFKIAKDGGSAAQLEGNVAVSLLDNTLETRIYMSDFVPYSLTAIYDQLLSYQEVIKDNTSFDGSIVFSIKLPSELLKLDNITKLELQAIDDLSNYVEGGLFSVNLAVRNLEVDSTAYSGAISFESTLKGSLLEVSSLAVSSNGLRLSYSGSIDYTELIPDGRLALQKADNGEELVALDFEFIDGTKSYSFKFSSPLLQQTSIYGILDWQEEQIITASAFIDSNYLTAGVIPFEVKVILNPLQAVVQSDYFNFDVSVENNSLVQLKGLLEGLEVKASDLISVGVTVDILASYDLLTGDFDFDVGNFSAKVSDFFGFSFASNINGEKLYLDNLKITRGEDTYVFDGAIEFDYPSISKLASITGEGISALAKLQDKDGIFSIQGTITDGQYYLKVKTNSSIQIDLNLLGTHNSGFYAYGSVHWGQSSGFDFNAQYKDGVFGLYDSSGNLGTLTLKDLDLNLDATNMSMLFSFTFENTVKKQASEDAHQGGTITLSAKLESFASSLISLITGLDFDLSFTLGLMDFYLEDGYTIPDTTVDVFYSKGLVTLNGNLINGTVDTANSYLNLHVDKSFPFGLDVTGFYGPELDLYVSNLYVPLPLINQFMDLVLLGFNQGDVTGDLLIQGSAKDPKLYGMLYCQSFEMWLAYLPSQTLSVKNIAVSVQDHNLAIAKTPVTGHSELNGRFLNADVSVSLDLLNLAVENLEITTNVYSPIDLWVPLPLGPMDLEIRGDVIGNVVYGINNGKPYLKSNAIASDMLVDFNIEDKQAWIYLLAEAIDIDLDLTIGSDVEFCYPQRDSAFIDFTLSEGESVHLNYYADTKTIETDGVLSFKTGQVYYFQNDFYITEGSLDLSPRKDGITESSGLSFTLDLTAKLNDYDSSGNKVEIDLILQNASLDNISPRFTSSPTMTENEILSLLGQTILPSSSFNQTVSMASVASLAAAATDAISRLGIIESNSNYSLTATIRDSIGFDIFSLRSNILQNIIIDALPGELSGKNDVSLLSRYLDGTSLFAGIYLANGVFAQMSFRLKSDTKSNSTSNYGHFLSNDLILDMEFSIDWDNPIGTFTIFTNPQELSAFNILDTIGFSVTKRIQF